MKYIALLLVVIGFASCAPVQKVETANTLNIYGPGVIQAPVVVDLEVRETKATGIAVGASTSLSLVKNLALVDAIKTSGADVLVEPTYEIEKTGGKVKAIVTGYPANYKNFRNATTADSSLIAAGYMHRVNTSVVDYTEKKRGGGFWAFAVILGAVIVAGIAGAF